MTIAMADPVEAVSLSSVTSIAANPPQHLGDPTQTPPWSLVLYIARVPGSQDVFLTPLKPRDRVVTAEDVQSSLYYVHVNCPEDYEADLLPASMNSDSRDFPKLSEGLEEDRPPLPKRLPPPAARPYPVEDSMIVRPLQPPAGLPRKPGIARKPVGANRSSKVNHASALPVLPPRPRPLPAIPADEEPYTLSAHEETPGLRQYTGPMNGANSERTQATASSQDHIDFLDRPTSGSLTLIRRDPSSDEQWNVAIIHDPPVHEVSSAALLHPTAARRTKKGGAPIYIDITNPAYQRFLDHDSSRSRTSTSSTTSIDSDPPPEGTFRRRLYMPGSRFREHGYGHDRRFGSVDLSTNSDDLPMRRTMRKSVDMSMLSDSSSAPTADRRSKGYNFTSPWDSYCDFSTTATGKSLRCRHHLPFRQSNGQFVTVSELRFNLPTASSASSSYSSSRNSTMLAEKRSSYFQGIHKRLGSTESASVSDSQAPSFILDEDGRIDLSLGQEKAGGGFAGRQAKLGKLIIEPEGMKMLDLLVAANVGLWWRAYGKI